MVSKMMQKQGVGNLFVSSKFPKGFQAQSQNVHEQRVFNNKFPKSFHEVSNARGEFPPTLCIGWKPGNLETFDNWGAV